MANTILDKCATPVCDGWSCALATPQQLITLLAAVAGAVLVGLMIFRLVKAPIADVGAGLAGLMAVGLVLLSLPIISKLSLSFAANQSIALEFKTVASAENVCTTANLVTEINKPLIERVARLEQEVARSDRTTALAPPAAKRAADVRIYYRPARADDAEKLRLALLPLFSFVDAVMTDLTEVGALEAAGTNRIRYEAIAPANWLAEANYLKTVVIAKLGKLDRGPDSVPRPLPGNIQVLLY